MPICITFQLDTIGEWDREHPIVCVCFFNKFNPEQSLLDYKQKGAH